MHNWNINLQHTRCALPPILLENFRRLHCDVRNYRQTSLFVFFFQAAWGFWCGTCSCFLQWALVVAQPRSGLDFFPLQGCLQKARSKPDNHRFTWSRWGSPSLCHHLSFSQIISHCGRETAWTAQTGLTIILKCSGKRES